MMLWGAIGAGWFFLKKNTRHMKQKNKERWQRIFAERARERAAEAKVKELNRIAESQKLRDNLAIEEYHKYTYKTRRYNEFLARVNYRKDARQQAFIKAFTFCTSLISFIFFVKKISAILSKKKITDEDIAEIRHNFPDFSALLKVRLPKHTVILLVIALILLLVRVSKKWHRLKKK